MSVVWVELFCFDVLGGCLLLVLDVLDVLFGFCLLVCLLWLSL